MDEKTLGEIEARAKAATPGPWAPAKATVREGLAGGLPILFAVTTREDHPDIAFAAHAREDVPALVAEVRRLREVNAGLVRILKDGGLIG